MILYHGSDKRLVKPEIVYARDNLDFGKGIYFTSYKKQAEKWAVRKKIRNNSNAYINIYKLNASDKEYNIKLYENETALWLDFVLACRNNSDIYKKYDIVIGPVADDDVFKVIDFYSKGIWTKERAIEKIKFFRQNNQICILKQEIIDNCLDYIKSEEV